VPIMTSHIPKIEVLSGPERRRRWSTAEKLAIVQETYEPDVTVSIPKSSRSTNDLIRSLFYRDIYDNRARATTPNLTAS
jgi:transposase-like protein